ncbi:MAG: TIGR02206 family membrane protein [Peptococcia bacterium]
MERYLSLNSELHFSLFSAEHLITLAFIVMLNLLIFHYRQKKTLKMAQWIRIIIAMLLILLELLMNCWIFFYSNWTLQNSLPLELCSITLILTSIMLLTKSKGLYELVYFWGLAGASQALLTPELYYGFPHFIYLQFFTAHGLIICACLWMTFVEGFSPDFKALMKAFGITNLYALLIAVFNWLTGSNYLFLCSKPANPSILDYLGPWPWYILSLEGVALIFFFLVALPFLWPGSWSRGQKGQYYQHF